MSALGQKADICPLLGVKRTLLGPVAMSAFDPKRTFGLRGISDLFLWVLDPFDPPCAPVVPFKFSGGSF
jgi:hypothetical protein